MERAVSPRGTPAPVIARLNAAVVKVLATAEVATKLTELGVHPIPGSTPESVARFLAREIEIWRPIVAATGVTID